MYILGISAFYHDSAVVLIKDQNIIAAVQEERFTRKKHDSSFPANGIRFCLEEAGLSINELDGIAFYDKPLLKFERLLETYYNYTPKGVRSFITAIPVWAKEKLFLKDLIYKELKEIEPYDKKSFKLLFPEHHLSHAASTYYPSPYMDSAILTIDGVGEWATASICHGKGRQIKILKELRFPHSVGLLYSAFTYYLGFKVNSGEYKLMGLAPYGDPTSKEVQNFKKVIRGHLVDIKEDGSICLDQAYFNYAAGLRMCNDKKWEALFGFPRRKLESELEQKHCNLALACQQITEDIVLRMALEAKKLTGSENLCMAGGVALNCVANGKLNSEGIFKNLYIQPAAGDAGGALGAALAAYHIHFDKEREKCESYDWMKGSYLGPEFSYLDIERVGKRYKANYQRFETFSDLTKKVATILEDGSVVGWFQGKMEWGPRALGNRSIIGDPRNPEMQKKLNLKIKYRESFRPFAPAVLAEDSMHYFDLIGESPYMLLVDKLKKEKWNTLPNNYFSLPLKERLYIERSELPAITHIDFSARIQTIHKDTNFEFWTLLNSFKNLTGCSVLVNTSFNVRGEPIVCTPEDAYRCFMRTEMDFLVLNNYLFDKTLQPDWPEKDDWRQEFTLD